MPIPAVIFFDLCHSFELRMVGKPPVRRFSAVLKSFKIKWIPKVGRFLFSLCANEVAKVTKLIITNKIFFISVNFLNRNKNSRLVSKHKIFYQHNSNYYSRKFSVLDAFK